VTRETGGRLEKRIAWLLLGLVAVFLLAEAAMNLAPPTSRDALIHHLALPKIWIANGGIIETPWADFSYYPMHIDLLYFGCLLLGSDTAPKYVHQGFGLGTGLLLFWFVNRRSGRPWGAVAAAVFVTTPLVVWLSTAAYVDLGMTFFTTASLLCLLQWREDRFEKPGWLWLSGLAMGLAAGSKYNALIAWMIVNLLVVFVYVRHSGRQLRGVAYGFLFFTLAALAASPWYIRNWLLTGNPFYPLFSSVFQALGDGGMTSAIGEHLARQADRISFFEMRRVMYGENFLETLLIPLRMFFQGQDDSYRYFQGVLNPILIVFVPFAFINRRHLADKGVLAAFSAVFVTIAYFTTEKQVRYLLPVIPTLAVLTVMGIEHLMQAVSALRHPTLQNLARGALVAVVAALFGFNIAYLKDRFVKIDPVAYITGKEDRTKYLTAKLHHYPAVVWINRHLPADARIFTFFLGRRGYYLDRTYRNEPSFGRGRLTAMVLSAGDEKAFDRVLDTMEATHLLVRVDLWNLFLRDNFSEAQIGRFAERFAKSFAPVYEKDGYAVYERVFRG
jgi:hypothetical protein